MRSTLLESKTRDLPQEWATCKLYEFASFTKGKQPTRFHDRYEKGFLPYLTTDYLRKGLSPKYCHVNDDVVHAGAHDALLIWDGSNAGEFFAGVDGVVASTMVKVWGKDANTIHDKFLFYVLMNSSKILSSTTNGTSIPHVSLSVFKNLGIPLPPLPEQRKIAEILSTVDETIKKTDTIIQKTQQLKKGLMQKLFTEGIGHTRFKETKTGRIPEVWEVVRLAKVSEIRSSNVDKKSYPSEIPVHLCNYLDVYNNEYIDEKIDFMEATATTAEIEKFSLNKGDVIITKDSETADDIAVPSVVIEALNNVLCGYHLALLQPNAERVDSIFLSKLLSSTPINNQFVRLAQGLTRFGLNVSSIQNAIIPLPSLDEQHQIAQILSEVDTKIETEQAFKAELEQLKTGLMQVLLTGKVRVKG